MEPMSTTPRNNNFAWPRIPNRLTWAKRKRGALQGEVICATSNNGGSDPAVSNTHRQQLPAPLLQAPISIALLCFVVTVPFGPSANGLLIIVSDIVSRLLDLVKWTKRKETPTRILILRLEVLPLDCLSTVASRGEGRTAIPRAKRNAARSHYAGIV